MRERYEVIMIVENKEFPYKKYPRILDIAKEFEVGRRTIERIIKGVNPRRHNKILRNIKIIKIAT